MKREKGKCVYRERSCVCVCTNGSLLCSGGIRCRDSGGSVVWRCIRRIGVKLVGNSAASGATGLDESRSVIRHARRRRRRSGTPHCIFGATAAAAYHCIANGLFFLSCFLPCSCSFLFIFLLALTFYLLSLIFLSLFFFLCCFKNACCCENSFYLLTFFAMFCYNNSRFLPTYPLLKLCTLLHNLIIILK